jgi:biopolymer transport protein TolR
MGASIKAAGAGGRKRRRHGHAPMSEINVTPFVDVMLVLLIIFMVAAPLMTGGVPLDLPQTKASQLDSPKTEPLQISIAPDGQIYLGQQDKEVTRLDELVPKLKAIVKARGGNFAEEPVFVRAHRASNYGLFAGVMAEMQRGGFRKLNIVSENQGG